MSCGTDLGVHVDPVLLPEALGPLGFQRVWAMPLGLEISWCGPALMVRSAICAASVPART